MKRLIGLCAAALGVALLCGAAEPSTAVKDAVTKAEAEWKDAVLKGDRSALERLIADDLSYTHSSGKTQTKREFIDEAAGGALNYKALDFEDTVMRQYGDAVIVTHKATISTAQTGTSHLYLTEVWAKVHGHWQLATRQALKLP